jgi:hypothetical protein
MIVVGYASSVVACLTGVDSLLVAFLRRGMKDTLCRRDTDSLFNCGLQLLTLFQHFLK